MITPLISVVIPCYNHGEYIDEAIQSVEEYTRNDYEIIIVNDGSNDELTVERLKELKNSGYHIIFQENQGLAKSRNNAIRVAKGKYILPLDADNKITPQLIEESVSVLENSPEIAIVYSDRREFGGRNRIVQVEEFSFLKMLRNNYIDACAVYRKSVWTELGGYDENLPILGYEDWDFWLRAGKQGMIFYHIPKPLFSYRVVEFSMLHRLLTDPNLQDLLHYIYEKHRPVIIDEYIRLAKIEKRMERMNNNKLRTSAYYLIRWLLRKDAKES